jgi:ParB family chromosome partitioning protein
MLRTDNEDSEEVTSKPKNGLPESLRRDLAAYRSQVAQVEIAKHPAIALDLLVFQVASKILGRPEFFDGPDVAFNHSRAKLSAPEPNAATAALEALQQALPQDWRKPRLEAARFEEFCSLSLEAKLELLAYCVATTLQPKLGTSEGAEPTAYDGALALTGASVADYWRPTKDNFLKRRTRDQLLAIMREVLGDSWALASSTEKKSLMVDQLHRAFADPAKYGQTAEHVEKLKTWLPAGMAFGTVPTPKPAKGKKVKKAA